jgi:magnesium chelatase family protein
MAFLLSGLSALIAADAAARALGVQDISKLSKEEPDEFNKKHPGKLFTGQMTVAHVTNRSGVYSCKRGRVDRCTSDYQARISGPLMDRIDLRIEVPAVTAADLILPPPTEGSAEVAARVAAARDVQMARYSAAGLPHIRTNAEAPASVLETIAQPDAQGLKLLRDAAETMRLSARGYHRVLRVARTLADLDGAEKIGRLHLAEALSYRALAEDLRRAA